MLYFRVGRSNGTNGSGSGNGSHPQRRGGRPCKLSPKVREAIADAIRVGATQELATKAAGIGLSTFKRWMQRGEVEAAGPYRALWAAVKKAEGDGAKRWLDVIEKAATDGSWQAAAWKLERRYPETYGRRVEVKANVTEEQIATQRNELIVRVLGNDETRKLANRLAINIARTVSVDAGSSSRDVSGDG